MDIPKDETALNQFLCFKFSDNADNQRLYDCLFLTDELNVGYFYIKCQVSWDYLLWMNIKGFVQKISIFS